MEGRSALERSSLGVGGRFGRSPTRQQRRALQALGVGEASVRHAAFGADLFAYMEDEHSTLRLQIAPDGGVVAQTVLNREPHGLRGQETEDRRSDGGRNAHTAGAR